MAYMSVNLNSGLEGGVAQLMASGRKPFLGDLGRSWVDLDEPRIHRDG